MKKSLIDRVGQFIESVVGKLESDIIHEGINGHCDAFALALADVLSRSFPGEDLELAPVLVQRRRTYRRSLVEYNDMSHVLLYIKCNKEPFRDLYADVCGTDADERWEDDWIQPSRSEGHDEFIFNHISWSQLATLRQNKDSRSIDKKMANKFSKAMGGPGSIKIPALTTDSIPTQAPPAKKSRKMTC